MHKFALLTAAAALLLASCETPQKWRTWNTVKTVRHPGPFVKDQSATYAASLHRSLQAARVEHKVVTFKFRYRSRILLNREGEETAVIYRDTATPSVPWWLMSERLWSPVWLPTQPVESQVAFYMRRPVTAVKVVEFAPEAAKPATPSKSKSSGKKQAGRKHAGKGGSSSVKPSTHSVKPKAKKPKDSTKKSRTSHRTKK